MALKSLGGVLGSLLLSSYKWCSSCWIFRDQYLEFLTEPIMVLKSLYFLFSIS